jgi:hypothetical protein
MPKFSHQHRDLPSDPFPSGYLMKILYAFLISVSMLLVLPIPSPLYLIILKFGENTDYEVLIMQLSLFFCYLYPIALNIVHFFLMQSKLVFFGQGETKFHTLVKEQVEL